MEKKSIASLTVSPLPRGAEGSPSWHVYYQSTPWLHLILAKQPRSETPWLGAEVGSPSTGERGGGGVLSLFYRGAKPPLKPLWKHTFYECHLSRFQALISVKRRKMKIYSHIDLLTTHALLILGTQWGAVEKMAGLFQCSRKEHARSSFAARW